MRKILKKIIGISIIGLLIPVTAIALVAIQPNQGGTGTLTAPTTGQVLVGQSDGTYNPQATSTLNIISSSIPGGYAGMLTSWLTSSSLTATSAPTASYYISTSTSKPSIFPYASTTGISSGAICLTGDICRTTWPTGGGSSSLYASSTNPLMSTYFVATSTNTASRINSYLKIGDVIPLQLSGLGTDYTDFQIDKDRDDTVGINIFNRSAGTQAVSSIFLNNNLTTEGGAGLAAKYYAGLAFAGSNFNGVPLGVGALTPNAFALYNTDGKVIIGSATTTGEIDFSTGAGSFSGNPFEMVLDSSGRLGIGSTPAVNLDVKKSGTGEVARFTITDGATINGLRVSVDTATANHITTLSSTGSFTGGFAFKTGATEVLRIATSGNVGISTTTPSAKLDVYSTDQAVLKSDSNSTSGTRVLISNTNNSSLDNNYGFVQGGTGTYKDKFQIARMNYNMGINSNIMTIDSNSYIGIGTTSPYARLDIQDTNSIINSRGNIYIHTNSFSTDYGGQMSLGGWANASGIDTPFAAVSGRKSVASGGYLSFMSAAQSTYALTERMRITENGNVGVGTTTPWATLSVAGTNGQTNANPVFAVSTSTATFATTTALMVDGSGRVGIATKSPSTALTVGDGSLLQIPNGVGTSITPDILVSNSNATSGTASIALGISDGTRNRRVGLFLDDKNSIAGISSTYGGTSFPFIMRDAGGERIRFDTTGNVNVGTSTTVGQSAQFSIRNTGSFTNGIQLFSGLSNTTIFSVNGTNGNVSMNGNLSATGGSITTVNGVFNSTAAVVPVLANGSASQTANLFEASKALVKYTVIDSGGDVGAGTSTPMAKLSATAKTINETTFALQGLTGQTGNLMSIYPSNSSTTVFSMNPTGGIFANSASTTLYFAGLLSSGTGNALCITTNNQVTNAGGGTCTPSSEKYKNSIKDFNGNALDELNKLKIVTFNYNDGVKTVNKGDTKQRIGMIAEQVEKIDPRLVIHLDGSPDSLNDRDLLSLTIKAVQEQQKEIDSLKAEINRLKK